MNATRIDAQPAACGGRACQMKGYDAPQVGSCGPLVRSVWTSIGHPRVMNRTASTNQLDAVTAGAFHVRSR